MERRNKRRKTLPNGECFKSISTFPSGLLPTKRTVLQRTLHEDNFKQKAASNVIAKELRELWDWCGVVPVSEPTVTDLIHRTILKVCKFESWPKLQRSGPKFLERQADFCSDLDELFDIYCKDRKQRHKLEIQRNLRMADVDFSFYDDQKGPRLQKCYPIVEKLSEADINFARKASGGKKSYVALRSEEDVVSNNADAQDYDENAEDSTDTEAESIASGYYPCSPSKGSNQNRKKWPHLARMCERYRVTDRCGAAIASSALMDAGVITETDKSLVIDKDKLRRERVRERELLRAEEDANFSLVDALYFDGKKDITLSVETDDNGKRHINTILEEHYVVVGEPEEFYLAHFSPVNGKGKTIASNLFDIIKNTALQEKLLVVGSDGTAVMTGAHKGCIRTLEELLKRPLQWVICLLHCNELPLRHVFMFLDGTTKSPDSFSGPIGQKLSDNVRSWPVANFKRIHNPGFPELPNDVIDDLSTDQHYAYRICMAIITGEVDPDLESLDIGPPVHSRWLTLACRISRYYTSQEKPSKNLVILAEFCIKIYFPSWFQIKYKNKITNAAENFYDMLERTKRFPKFKVKGKTVSDIAIAVLERNAYSAHPENILLNMLGDSDENTRRIAVNKILSLRGKLPAFHIPHSFDGNSFVEQDDDDVSDDEATASSEMLVRKFKVPVINKDAKVYYNMINLNNPEIEQPPAIRDMTDDEINEIRRIPLYLKHPCHNQKVERHVKLVSEASLSVTGYERRDGMIRQRIRSRKLMKKFDSKFQFNA